MSGAGVAAWCWLLGHVEAGSIPISISSLMMEAGHPYGVQGKGHTLETLSSTPTGISSCDGICIQHLSSAGDLQ